MISARSSVLLLTTASALALQGHVDAAPCDADNYSKVATAVQNLHANCASWTAYLANGGVWTCDSKCHDAVANLVDALPDCTFGGPYGQNYKEVVENMVKSCGGQETSTSESTTAPSSAPIATTEAPSATAAAPSSVNRNKNSTEAATTDTPAATTKSESPTTENDDDAKDPSDSASASAGEAGTPASDVSTTSGAGAQTVTSVIAMLLVVVVALLQ